MIQLLLKVLQAETELTIQFKVKGHKVVKPSIILAGFLTLFYLLSPVDIIPEKWIHPWVFGLVDDLILLTACTIYIISNINIEGGLENVRAIKIPDMSNVLRKSEVPLANKRDNDVPTGRDVANPGVSTSNPVQTMVGNTVSPSTDAVAPDVGSDEDDCNTVEAGTNFTDDDEDFLKESSPVLETSEVVDEVVEEDVVVEGDPGSVNPDPYVNDMTDWNKAK